MLTPGGEAGMRSLILAVVLGTVAIAVSSVPIQAGTWDYPCPYPPSYPRGWELMVRTCPVIGPYYAYPRYDIGYPYPRYSRAYVTHRRPYLRPGWWW